MRLQFLPEKCGLCVNISLVVESRTELLGGTHPVFSRPSRSCFNVITNSCVSELLGIVVQYSSALPHPPKHDGAAVTYKRLSRRQL